MATPLPRLLVAVTLGALAALAACEVRPEDPFTDEEWRRLSTLSGLDPPPVDPTNRWCASAAAAALGQRLYFDPAFSGRSRQVDSLRRPTTVGRAPLGQPLRMSCASCHALSRAGTDVESVPGNVSAGAALTDVNALPTVNAAYHPALFWNGRIDSLWGLNLVVAESDTTMNGNRLQTAHVLAERYAGPVSTVCGSDLGPSWPQQVATLPAEGKPGRTPGCQAGDAGEPAGDAYDCLSPDDQELASTLLVIWAKAIAAFEQRLTSRFSAFDAFMTEGRRSRAIPASARRGARLFVGKAGCFDCHNGPLLTDEQFHDIGVPQLGPGVPTVSDCAGGGSGCDCVGGKNCLPWGAYNGQIWQRDTGPRWWPLIDRWNDATAAPRSPPAEPFDPATRGAWRTPSLRDVALTAPYMHDGVYATLEEVIWHYDRGARDGVATAVGIPSAKLHPLGLDQGEVADLVAFLKTLTGDPLPESLTNPTGLPLDGAPVATMPPPLLSADAGLAPDDAAAPATDARASVAAVAADVQTIFETSCSPCHTVRKDGGLDLSAGAAFASLVGAHATGPGCTDRVRVVPGDPAASYIIAKLRRTGLCGAPMPMGRPALRPDQIAFIEGWIAKL
jgi:cytochrome c peroxidase